LFREDIFKICNISSILTTKNVEICNKFINSTFSKILEATIYETPASKALEKRIYSYIKDIKGSFNFKNTNNLNLFEKLILCKHINMESTKL